MGQAADDLEPRIYVACLAGYNGGRLHGAWIDVEDDVDGVWGAIRAMLAASPEPMAEEFVIHDYEGFGGVEIAEYASIARVVEIATFPRERGRLGALVLAEVGGDLGAAADALDDQYHGVFASPSRTEARLLGGVVVDDEGNRHCAGAIVHRFGPSR